MAHYPILEVVLPNDPTKTFTIGVITDTHIPDRNRQLHPNALRVFQAAEVNAIFHAGDIAIPSVLEALKSVAPVYAVRGNRDWAVRKLPMNTRFTIGSVQIGLSHGHGGLSQYLRDKVKYFAQGFQAERYHAVLRAIFPAVQVIIYGHTHYPDQTWWDQCLFFNSGAAGHATMPGYPPSVGLLEIKPGGQILSEIIPLD